MVNIKPLQVAYHRNGISGEGFYAVLFDDAEHGRMVATVFDGPGQVAVLAVGPLATDVGVAFGENSWRGDHYAPALRAAIHEHNKDGKYAAGSVRMGPFSIPTGRPKRGGPGKSKR